MFARVDTRTRSFADLLELKWNSCRMNKRNPEMTPNWRQA